MLKQNWRIVSRVERVGDLLLGFFCFFLAYYARPALLYWNDVYNLSLPFEGDELAPLKDYFLVLVVGVGCFLFALQVLGAYSSMRLSGAWRLVGVAFLSALFTFLGLAAALFTLKVDISRSFILLFCIFLALFFVLERWFVLRALRYWRRRGKNFRNLIITGLSDVALEIAEEVTRRPELGLRLKGFVALTESEEDKRVFKEKLLLNNELKVTRIIDGQDEVIRVIEDQAIDEVVFTQAVKSMQSVEELLLVCSDLGIRTSIVADMFSLGVAKSSLSYFGDRPIIYFQPPPGDGWELVAKRVIDFVVSGFLLVVLAPVFFCIALLVLFSSGAPVFSIQRRVGLNGRLFHLYKFRSMITDADKQLEKLREKNEMDGPVFKMTNDPRVTKVGKWLRRFSLDELPQLWNVFKGDMSLVGPRPPIPGEVSLYERSSRRRLSMRPGLTCTWQVSGRNKINDFQNWVKLDLEYIDNWSLGRDLKLILKTVPAVIFGEGAK